MTSEYVPDSGHFVWVSLDPQCGHEREGRRPLLVLSPASYNVKTSLVVGVPVTAKRKGYPFQVVLPPESVISGVVMADQIKSLDWRARAVEYAADADRDTLRDVRSLIATLLVLR